MTDLDGLIRRLEGTITGYGAARAIVAFSGGVDSAVVLAVSAGSLGRSAVTAVTAVSPSYPAGELTAARELAASLGVGHRTVRTDEVVRESYARNDSMRCFHCKTELYATLTMLASAEASPDAVVLAGANADDLGDFRPGLRASARHGIKNPLLEEGIGKAVVRSLARRLKLGVAEKPALACLSSRVAYGIRITAPLLTRIDRAEQVIRRLGFVQVRVRHLGDTASIEVPGDQVPRLTRHSGLPRAMEEVRALGWREVLIDRRGYRTGSLNEAL